MTAVQTDILLATYNGARYLPQLLESLDCQTDQCWRLLVRDDGSDDETLAVLKDWGKDKGDRFSLLIDDLGNLGASGNFGTLLNSSTGDYFLPCDQDDYWLPHKVSQLKKLIQEIELEHGTLKPAIAHTDLAVVDENLNPIADSFWKYQRVRLQKSDNPWKLLTMQNTVTGCAMIGNSALREISGEVPNAAYMHDWWMAVVAALFGHIASDPIPSVKYRQHDGNTLGAVQYSIWEKIRTSASSPLKTRRYICDLVAQSEAIAAAAHERFQGELNPCQEQFLATYKGISGMGLIARSKFRRKHSLWYNGLIRNVAITFVS